MPESFSKRVAVIIPVYNGAETIRRCLDAALNIDYPHELMEILIVDDGSTDNTLDIVSELNSKRIKVISNLENKGRAYTRLRGADEAVNEMLFFVDSRAIVSPDVIKVLIKYDEPVQMPKTITGSGNLWGTALGALRRTVFRNSEIHSHIDKENFYDVPKGTTSLFILKRLFQEASHKIDYKNRHVNEDTGLLWHIVKEGHRIFRNPDFSIMYLQRKGFKDNIAHLFERGPRFVEHYYGRHSGFTLLIRLFLFMLAASLMLFTVYPRGICYLLSILLLSDILFCAAAGRNARERVSILLLLPLIFSAFSLGILKGMLVRRPR
ncbi:MAG: glycosyltransferase family 2 protein [Nitrospirae bacterium]|nr:glycosyltransferase family 2 protein [Nitrospirota bacterium]